MIEHKWKIAALVVIAAAARVQIVACAYFLHIVGYVFNFAFSLPSKCVLCVYYS